MYKLAFTLKQHTPIIHFQHEQAGATLRATELKPKLDLFIMKKLLQENTVLENNQPVPDHRVRTVFKEVARQYGWEGWLAGKGKAEHVSLDYKVRIDAKNVWTHEIEYPRTEKGQVKRSGNETIQYEQFPCFFANMGEDSKKDPKYFSFTNDFVSITILAFSSGLGEAINKWFNDFILNTNFGSRQSKGFGSFFPYENVNGSLELVRKDTEFLFVVGIKYDEFDKWGKSDYVQKFPGRSFDRSIQEELFAQRIVFKAIEIFHKIIRSGYNNGRNAYIKSALFKYCKDHNMLWDKRIIKLKYFADLLEGQIHRHPGSDILEWEPGTSAVKGNQFLVRDLLGLASDANWGKTYNNATITKYHPEIKRFKSPITYKPVKLSDDDGIFYYVNILWEPINAAYLNKSFEIKAGGNGDLVLDTPATFSIKDYLSYLQSENFDLKKMIADGSKGPDIDLAHEIFKSFKGNDYE